MQLQELEEACTPDKKLAEMLSSKRLGNQKLCARFNAKNGSTFWVMLVPRDQAQGNKLLEKL